MAKAMKETSKEQKGLMPWRQFPEMTRWGREMERVFGNFFGGRIPSLYERLGPAGNFGIQEPALDLYEDKDEIVVKAELPGMAKDDIQVSVTDNVLTIKGEKRQEEENKEKEYYRSERVYGAFLRSVALPTEVNPGKVRATFKNGVLEVRLPKSEAAKKKEIKINVQ
jgi:HSP20 family protein